MIQDEQETPIGSKKIYIDLSNEELAKLKREAKADNRTMTNFCKNLLKTRLNELACGVGKK